MPLTVPNIRRLALSTAMMSIPFVGSTITHPAAGRDMLSQISDNRASDRVAFDAALALKDPRAKLNALYAFRDQFPDSDMVTDSEQIIFELLVEHWPDRRNELHTAIDRIVGRIPSSYPSFTAHAPGLSA